MFKPNNKIIIVDDLQDHLNTLSKPFHDNGIGCKCFQYDPTFNSPLKNVRLAFFDININPTGGGSRGQKLNEIANAIKQYIHVDNGPYALIFWTSNKEEISAIKDHIHSRHKDCPKPFLVDYIDKAEFLNNAGNLTIKLEKTLDDETLKILFQFEEISSDSASLTINELYKIIPNEDKWGETTEFRDNFDKVFSKIAVSANGFIHAKRNPDNAINEALLPILQYNFFKSAGKIQTWNKVLKTLNTAQTRTDIPYIKGFKESILNTIFHIDLSKEIHPITRGAVLKYNLFPKRGVLHYNYFKNLESESLELFQNFIKFSEKINKDEQLNFSSSCKWVAVEISSACDFSQNKPRNNKYVLALLTPDIDRSMIAFDKISEAVFYKDIPVINYQNTDHRIWINFNYSFSDFETTRNLGEPIFLIKKELMDLIGNRYANHISRIGITSF